MKTAGKKVLGVFLILIGIIAFFTPLTPGSWLAVVGLELLGVRFLAWEKMREWLRTKRRK